MRYSFNFMQFLEFVSIAFFGDGINPLSKSDKKWSHETNNQGVGEFLATSFLLGAAGWGLDKANVRLRFWRAGVCTTEENLAYFCAKCSSLDYTCFGIAAADSESRFFHDGQRDKVLHARSVLK